MDGQLPGNLIEHLACIWLRAPDYDARLEAGYEAFWVLEDPESIHEYLKLRAALARRMEACEMESVPIHEYMKLRAALARKVPEVPDA